MKKILVIDDAEYILDSTSTLLGFEGYDVVTASNGFDGIEKAITEFPDLIVCDVSMPGMDGYEVLEKIRSNPLTKTTAFIFLTAYTDKTNMRSGMERGADDYLFKPFTRNELIAAIEAQFKKSNTIREHMQERVDELSKNITSALPHEFRTVLNQIIGNSKYLFSNADTLEKSDIKDLSSDILSASQRMLKISENYLIYAQIESFVNNKNKLAQLKSFRTNEPGVVVSDTLSSVAFEYGRSDDFRIIDETSNITLIISSDNFHKIINELIDNAFRFSNSGSEVIVSIKVVDENFIVTISDNGRGMTKEQIQKIGAYMQFEREIYEQQGVGLGLSIAKRMVELHDGKFNITSIPGKSTIIELIMPCIY